jgi:hypothetical protein
VKIRCVAICFLSLPHTSTFSQTTSTTHLTAQRTTQQDTYRHPSSQSTISGRDRTKESHLVSRSFLLRVAISCTACAPTISAKTSSQPHCARRWNSLTRQERRDFYFSPHFCSARHTVTTRRHPSGRSCITNSIPLQYIPNLLATHVSAPSSSLKNTRPSFPHTPVPSQLRT